MKSTLRLLVIASLTLTTAACATQSSGTSEAHQESAPADEQAAADVSEEQLILVNSDIEYVYQQVTAELSKSKVNRKWARAKRRGNQVSAAIYPPIVRSEQKLAGMISALFTKIEEDLERNYTIDMVSPLPFRGAQQPEDGTIVTDTMLQRARDNEIQYLITGIIDAERGSTSATYAFDIRVIEAASGDVAFQTKVVREKP